MSALVGAFLLVMSQAGNAVTIAEAPLFIAAGTTPNVMLVVDNSGSMNSIIWATGFDSRVTYPDWSPLVDHDCNTGTATREAWAPTDSSVLPSSMTSTAWRGACAVNTTGTACTAGKTRGRNAAGTVTKCLTLPDPLGGGGTTRYTGNYLNYLFNIYADNTVLNGGQIPNDTRMNVARNVATQVVTNNANLRLGLTRFNPPVTGDNGPGGRVIGNCATGNTASLNTLIAALTASTNTPLAETLYEVTRYFRGMSSQFNAGVTYTSPILYRCQKNFVIVITDGYPTEDVSIPTNDPLDVANTSKALPNWDGLAPATTAAMYPNFPQYSDGYQPSGTQASEGFSLYLDDVAKFAF
ncbi:MAG: pilus assembly protein, partial [Gammaproteobacteria bacterium]